MMSKTKVKCFFKFVFIFSVISSFTTATLMPESVFAWGGKKGKGFTKFKKRRALKEGGQTTPLATHGAAGAGATAGAAATATQGSETAPANPETTPAVPDQIEMLKVAFCRNHRPTNTGTLHSLFYMCFHGRNDATGPRTLSAAFAANYNATWELTNTNPDPEKRKSFLPRLTVAQDFRRAFFETQKSNEQMNKEGKLPENIYKDKMSCQASESPASVSIKINDFTLDCGPFSLDAARNLDCGEMDILLKKADGSSQKLCAY